MARVKGGPKRTQRRKGVLKQTKGFSAGRKNLTRQAKTAAKKAGQRAYDHRKLKKRQFRALWQIKIGAGARQNGVSYSKFMGGLKRQNIELDRKILADFAQHHPELFTKVVEAAK